MLTDSQREMLRQKDREARRRMGLRSDASVPTWPEPISAIVARLLPDIERRMKRDRRGEVTT